MRRLSQLCLLRPTAVASPPRGALALTCTSSTALQLRCAGMQRRVVRPTEEGLVDLMDDDDHFSHSSGAPGGPPKEYPALSSLVASASLYQHAVNQDSSATNGGAIQQQSRGALDATRKDAIRSSEGAVDVTAEAAERGQAPVRNTKLALTGAVEGVKEGGAGPDEADPLLEEGELHSTDYIEQQQSIYYEMPVQSLMDAVCAYLRSSENVALVSSQEEHILFPVLFDRLQEFHVSQLLDILDCHWSRSTMLRYGTTFKDAVRDRIAQLATAAATILESKRQKGTSISSFAERDGPSRSGELHEDDGALPEEDDDAIFVQDEQRQAAASSPSSDVILTCADKEINSTVVYRALVVTGMSGGRRKRDLAFFQLLGNYLTYFINDYRDPHELVRVLTALARAKIVPSPAFLSLLARRLPVLHKRMPLEPVPAYRAMSNFARMGHTSMNTFRFLADCMLSHMEKNIREEKKQLRNLRAEAAARETQGTGDMTESTVPARSAETIAAAPPASGITLEFLLQADNLPPEVAAKERLRRISGLKPSSFTRLLLILARLNAPHQQYLRPLIAPVILPMIPYLPPPSFTRLLMATQRFHSNDTSLVEAYMRHMCDVLAPAGRLTRSDVLELLQLLSHEDTPVPADLERFLQVCQNSLKSATSAVSAQEKREEVQGGETVRKSAAVGTVTFILRPQHMCRVIHCIGAFQRKVEIPLETLSPLVELAEDFARRLAFLMELSVVTLQQVDEFVELCERHQIPDSSGAIQQLSTKRYDVVHRPREAKGGATEDLGMETEAEADFYSQLDVDVRETFQKILIANDFNTYGGYRPLPGPLQVDFREELTKVTAFELLQSTDLFNKACPGALRAAPRMFLSRSLLEKVGKEGEVVVVEETNRLVVRQPRAELLTREDLQRFLELVERTPLEAVRNAPAMWIFIKEKAERLGVAAVVDTATQRLCELRSQSRRKASC
ncbi:putative mitochondrial RNA binding complex 1 subunit [Leptomonas seymouri]|uniref:Putative mitochondrial RNA binding complex 1 subunit n=1 Tax=Leptomonas seymouri TaxID=5684 RepID=A0A0N1PDG9_LEPSE|nr:putative mitochondrial RNA binding complex 1 subunit [Leptomonas seymouri]|eukprot:KPI90298.1 putative mitochondrial RNA binding complex 1 subunit [Leptomonas seymouri]